PRGARRGALRLHRPHGRDDPLDQLQRGPVGTAVPAGLPRAGPPPRAQARGMRPRSSRQARICPTLASTLSSRVRITSSGASGGSYGGETPVNSGISPAPAFLYG